MAFWYALGSNFTSSAGNVSMVMSISLYVSPICGIGAHVRRNSGRGCSFHKGFLEGRADTSNPQHCYRMDCRPNKFTLWNDYLLLHCLPDDRKVGTTCVCHHQFVHLQRNIDIATRVCAGPKAVSPKFRYLYQKRTLSTRSHFLSTGYGVGSLSTEGSVTKLLRRLPTDFLLRGTYLQGSSFRGTVHRLTSTSPV